MSKYTVYSDYYATGEGRTISVLYTHAENDADALTKFHKLFGIFYATGAEIIQGWDFDVSDGMVSDVVQKIMEDGQCFTSYSAQFYVNCS